MKKVYNKKYFKSFVLKQKCIPWKIYKFFHERYYRGLYCEIRNRLYNINTQKHWDDIWILEKKLPVSKRHYPYAFNKICSTVDVGSRVVDIGCGIGILMEKLKKEKYCDVLGIDISRSAINILNERGMKGIVAKIPPIPLPSEYFDVAIATELLEHLNNHKKAIKEMVRIIKPLGTLVIMVPDSALTSYSEREHVITFNEKKISRLLSKIKGIKNIEILKIKEENDKFNHLIVKAIKSKNNSDRVHFKKIMKSYEELNYWKKCKDTELVLSNNHYEYFYTTHFLLDKTFYVGKRILDIGCGPRGSLEWAKMASERVGLDPLANSYQSLGIDKHKMKYVAANVEQIPFPDEYFDIIASFNSLDHVDNLHKTVRSIIRVLKQYGTFLLLTEVDHLPTSTEPTVFSWDIMHKFSPRLSVVDEKHYEKTENGMYQSILKGIFYNHERKELRPGILSARFLKIM